METQIYPTTLLVKEPQPLSPQIYKQKGHAGLICPHCYNATVIKAKITANVRFEDESLNEAKRAIQTTPLIFAKCQKCGEYARQIITSANLAKVSSILISKGYHVIFARDDQEVLNLDKNEKERPIIPARISLAENPEELNKKHPLPKSWSEVTPRTIYSDINTPIEQRVADIESWASYLPTINDGNGGYYHE